MDWLLTEDAGSTQSFRCLSTVNASRSRRCCFWHTGHSNRLASLLLFPCCGAHPWLICDILEGTICPCVPELVEEPSGGLPGGGAVGCCITRRQNIVIQLQQKAWSHGNLAGDESFSRQMGHWNSCMSLGYVNFPWYCCKTHGCSVQLRLVAQGAEIKSCLLYTSPSPRD